MLCTAIFAVARVTRKSSSRSWLLRSLCTVPAHKRSNGSSRSRRSKRGNYALQLRFELFELLERFEPLVFDPVFLPSTRNKIQMLLRRQRHRRILVLSCRVNADPLPDIPPWSILQDTVRCLGGIEPDGLDVTFYINIFVWPNTPT